LNSTNIPLNTKGCTPLSVEKSTFCSSWVKGGGVAERGKGKEIEDSSLSQPTLKKRRKLRVTDETEETQTPNKPRTRSSTERFPIPKIQTEFVECATQEIDEKQVEPGEEDADIKEVEQQLNKDQ
jgi:hypothetical protein